MKLIIKIFLLIICLGLLISCANNVDLSKIFNEDKTTQTTNNNTNNTTTHINNSTTQVNSTNLNPSTDEDLVYNHSLLLYYNGSLSFENGHKGFSCYFDLTNNSETEFDYFSLTDYFINFNEIIGVDGTIEIVSGNEHISRLKYENNNFYVGISQNRWYLITTFSVVDSVTLSVNNSI